MNDYTAEKICEEMKEKTGKELTIIEAKAMTKVFGEGDDEDYIIRAEGVFFLARVERSRSGKIENIRVAEISIGDFL